MSETEVRIEWTSSWQVLAIAAAIFIVCLLWLGADALGIVGGSECIAGVTP